MVSHDPNWVERLTSAGVPIELKDCFSWCPNRVLTWIKINISWYPNRVERLTSAWVPTELKDYFSWCPNSQKRLTSAGIPTELKRNNKDCWFSCQIHDTGWIRIFCWFNFFLLWIWSSEQNVFCLGADLASPTTKTSLESNSLSLNPFKLLRATSSLSALLPPLE